MRFLLLMLSVLVFVTNINMKVIPMAFMNQTSAISNDIGSNNRVLEIMTVDDKQIQFGPTQQRLEELYKIVMNMMIPCVNSLRSVEPLIRHNFVAMGVKVTEEEITALMIMNESPDFMDVTNACEGRIFGQPPLPWMT